MRHPSHRLGRNEPSAAGMGALALFFMLLMAAFYIGVIGAIALIVKAVFF